MTDNDSGNKYGSAPLGKSVEQVADESANRVNSPVQGETRRENEQQVIPAVINSNASSIPAVINPEALVEKGSDAHDGQAKPSRDTGEG